MPSTRMSESPKDREVVTMQYVKGMRNKTFICGVTFHHAGVGGSIEDDG
jgi:hypothetical protein